jgi:hypothetical protein
MRDRRRSALEVVDHAIDAAGCVLLEERGVQAEHDPKSHGVGLLKFDATPDRDISREKGNPSSCGRFGKEHGVSQRNERSTGHLDGGVKMGVRGQ